MKKISLIYSWFIWAVTFFVPDSRLTMRLRGFLYSLLMPKCGRNFQVSAGAKFFGIDKLYVGNDVFIATNVIINTGGKVFLHDGVMIGIGSVVVAGNHTLEGDSYRFGRRKENDIVISRGSWVSANCTVTSGSIFPASSVLAANSVFISNEILGPGIYGGVPARLVKQNSKQITGDNNG